MKHFIQKMYICLFEPRKMGLFFGERLYKAFLHIFLCVLVAILPYSISLIVKDEVSNLSYDIIEEWIMENNVDVTLQLENGILSGNENYAYFINEGILFINPTDSVLNLTLDESTYHVIEFGSEEINVYFFESVVFSKTYVELGVTELDFKKMENADYIEFDKFIYLINIAFENMKTSWVISNTVLIIFDIYLTAIISALLLGFIIKIFNPIIGYRFRFKAALDAQIVSIFFIFLMLLFDAEILRYIGIVFSCIYLVKAMLAIIRIEIKKKVFSDKEREE